MGKMGASSLLIVMGETRSRRKGNTKTKGAACGLRLFISFFCKLKCSLIEGNDISAEFCLLSGFSVAFSALHNLLHKCPHLLRRFLLRGSCGVSVSLEGETCIVVPQHGGDRFDVHTVLESQSCKRMSEVVEADVLQPGSACRWDF